MTPQKTERIEKLKFGMKKICKKCEEETGEKEVDACFSCPFHILFNQMFSEILNGI